MLLPFPVHLPLPLGVCQRPRRSPPQWFPGSYPGRPDNAMSDLNQHHQREIQSLLKSLQIWRVRGRRIAQGSVQLSSSDPHRMRRLP